MSVLEHGSEQSRRRGKSERPSRFEPRLDQGAELDVEQPGDRASREAGMSWSRTIDSTRASLAGHTFHHAWAVQSCLELLPADTDLERIALEGFARDDAGVEVSQSTDEVADLVRYRGGPDAQTTHRIEIVQFKYSIARAGVAVRAADLAKTAGKFAQVMRDHRADLGQGRADAVLRFKYLTNRPVDPDLATALEGLAGEAPLARGAADQAEVLRQATDLDGDDLALLARNLSVVGQGGSANRRSIAQEAGDCFQQADTLRRASACEEGGVISQNARAVDTVAAQVRKSLAE